MRYAGWYARRRGILEHLERGTISLLDSSIHDFLCLSADYRSGVAFVSAEKIHAQAGAGTSLRAVQRSLEKLESLGWIKRFRVPGRRGNYPTLIGRYFVRDSSLRWWSVSLERTTDWRDVKFDPVTDPSFVGNGAGDGGGAESGSEASRIKETRSETEEVRGFDGDVESDGDSESVSSAFEGFDLPKNGRLRLSENLFESLFIDEKRLSDKELRAMQKLVLPWQKSWRSIDQGQIKLDVWIEEATQALNRSRIFYPPILERRMHELRDGRLRAA